MLSLIRPPRTSGEKLTPRDFHQVVMEHFNEIEKLEGTARQKRLAKGAQQHVSII